MGGWGCLRGWDHERQLRVRPQQGGGTMRERAAGADRAMPLKNLSWRMQNPISCDEPFVETIIRLTTRPIRKVAWQSVFSGLPFSLTQHDAVM
jgi:hypothetical protein